MTDKVLADQLTWCMNELIKQEKYNPNHGKTIGKPFVSDFAEVLFDYGGMIEQLANKLVKVFRETLEWLPLVDSAAGLNDLAPGLIDAHGYSNQGYSVICGWFIPTGAGHTAVCVTGNLEDSEK